MKDIDWISDNEKWYLELNLVFFDNFELDRFAFYMENQFDELYRGTSDGRGRIEWALDKAYDDYISKPEILEILYGGRYE